MHHVPWKTFDSSNSCIGATPYQLMFPLVLYSNAISVTSCNLTCMIFLQLDSVESVDLTFPQVAAVDAAKVKNKSSYSHVDNNHVSFLSV